MWISVAVFALAYAVSGGAAVYLDNENVAWYAQCWSGRGSCDDRYPEPTKCNPNAFASCGHKYYEEYGTLMYCYELMADNCEGDEHQMYNVKKNLIKQLNKNQESFGDVGAEVSTGQKNQVKKCRSLAFSGCLHGSYYLRCLEEVTGSWEYNKLNTEFLVKQLSSLYFCDRHANQSHNLNPKLGKK